ncbi:PLP-dependent aminotransferase family protein [Treponema sp.]|uniref:MocR-like pyridoxine biosynthesis transcription factor PdxR n=1 Tax=Treponema sp. TaxID=166 RepID=UPI00257B9BE4|nr:PLP-dependent aminotransferase family protein [Treponema sp.]MBE6354913.1 PLP-dependent aminotransferase family protein [Treponema sp.]
MLTYDMSEKDKPLYRHLYECIRSDITSGKLKSSQKMPSKRTLAEHLGVSTITVENAYDQLISEGYMYAVPKRGYFVSDITGLKLTPSQKIKKLNIIRPESNTEFYFDFSSNRTERSDFPFSVWAKLMRETISLKEKELLIDSPCEGVRELREAIANHLSSFRGMNVDPDQVIVGAGTEYLYTLLIKLLGTDKVFAIENPGYKKLSSIYKSNGTECCFINLDRNGMNIEELNQSRADVAHISPTHHFPTGITMPISRRYEMLSWANEKNGRYIIEDDYDSEFRLNGKPIPSLQSIDAFEKVIYMNTFSKSLTSTFRISYMVLPEHLVNLFFKNLSFYSNTVSTFEQYTLASFISGGYFEKHINRMRLRYGRKRTRILEMIKKIFSPQECQVIENDSGLHFLLSLNTELSDLELQKRLLQKKIKIGSITDYYMASEKNSLKLPDRHQFILNYSGIDMNGLEAALREIKSCMYV